MVRAVGNGPHAETTTCANSATTSVATHQHQPHQKHRPTPSPLPPRRVCAGSAPMMSWAPRSSGNGAGRDAPPWPRLVCRPTHCATTVHPPPRSCLSPARNADVFVQLAV